MIDESNRSHPHSPPMSDMTLDQTSKQLHPTSGRSFYLSVPITSSTSRRVRRRAGGTLQTRCAVSRYSRSGVMHQQRAVEFWFRNCLYGRFWNVILTHACMALYNASPVADTFVYSYTTQSSCRATDKKVTQHVCGLLSPPTYRLYGTPNRWCIKGAAHCL